MTEESRNLLSQPLDTMVDLENIPVVTLAQLGSISLYHSPTGIQPEPMSQADREAYASGLRESARKLFAEQRNIPQSHESYPLQSNS